MLYLELTERREVQQIGILLAAIPVLAIFIDFFLSHSLLGHRYRWFVAPGVIVHELSHAAACLLTGAKIGKISVFAKEGGSVEHKKPKVPIIGQIFISIAPLLVGVAALYWLSRFIGFNQIDIRAITPTVEGAKEHLFDLARSIDLADRRSLLLFYLLLSIAVTMNPSVQDLMNIAVSAGLIAAVAYGVYRYTDFRPNFDIFIPEQLYLVLSTVVALLILSLFLSIIIFALSKIVKPV